MGGVLCRPLSRHRCRDQSRRHGVSDPAARARRGPAPVRRGRSRHGRLCRCRLSSTAGSAARSAAWLPHRTCLIATQIFRTIWSCLSGNVGHKLVAFARAFRPVVVLESSVSRASHSMSTCGCRDVSISGFASTPAAITTTMLHLCSAPCKALRFAPPARTRGLRALTMPARR
jgi:hypothetical protein